VPAGDTAEAVVIWKDTGNPATSPLIAYIDTITGWPIATSGGDIVAQWDNGAYKIFAIA
jgi:inactivated superfamily I helicase